MVQCVQRVQAGLLAIALLCLVGCQSPRLSARLSQPAVNDAPVKPGDVLLVTSSSNAAPFTIKWVVDSKGNVRLPYSGPWLVAGKKPSELAKELTQYFSVGKKVTFKVEKIGPPLPQSSRQKTAKRPETRSQILRSPKGAETAGAGGLRGNPQEQQEAAERVPDG